MNIIWIRFVQTLFGPQWDQFFIFITQLGEETFYILAIISIYWCLNKDFAFKLVIAFISSGLVNFSLKQLFHIARPIGHPEIRSLHLETATGYSFPSGHSQNAATFWTIIAGNLRYPVIVTLSFLMIFLIGFSRIYLGVHTPLDVGGGWLAGVILAFSLGKVMRQEFSNRIWAFLTISISTISLITLLVHPDIIIFKLTMAFISFSTGFILEKKYIQLLPPANFYRGLGRLIIGFAVLFSFFALIYSSGKNLSTISLKYLFLGWWVTLGAPLLFRRINF